MPTRRGFLKSALSSAALCRSASARENDPPPLEEFGYEEVQLAPGLAESQFQHTRSILLSLNDDALLKPWRLRAGLPAPGPDLGGWYDEVPLDKTESGGHGFAPAHCFGQWVSALARSCAIDGDRATRAKLERLLALYQPAISGQFYKDFRFPAYVYDKMVIGLIDAHQFAKLPHAFDLLEQTTNAALPHLPPRALDRDEPQRAWRASVGDSTANDYTWDESYTLPENQYLAWRRGAGDRYRSLARRFLLDRTYFDPLSENRNVLPNHHAYSFCNALSSAMQAYLSDASRKHLLAARNAFNMISATQSFATGGWGPNESFVNPGRGELFRSLTATHRGFETPCGSYAHCKLTRYLLRVTRDGRYGDSMERVLYNTVFGAKPLQSDGESFYYSDYNFSAKKSYFPDAWPCCSGTLPQVSADYRIMIYFREPAGVVVNLFLPSTLRCVLRDGAQLTLSQTGNYPMQSDITMRLALSRPSAFSISVRAPEWSSAIIYVNGQPEQAVATTGFLALARKWKDGDVISVKIPLPFRLEAIDAEHPDTVALIRGPIVLFPTGGVPKNVARRQLLSARQVANENAWRVECGGGHFDMRPFTSLSDEQYSTYLNVT